MKVFYATSTPYKISNMKSRVQDMDIQIVTPYDYDFKVEILEDGKDVIDNARIKATAYSELVDMPVIATDSALFVDDFKVQPGLFVRRVPGKFLKDDDLEDYYAEQLKSIGGSSKAHYVTGLVLIKDGECKSIEVLEDEFLFTAKRYSGKKSEDPLGRLEFDEKLQKYFCELTEDEVESRGYVFDKQVKKFLQDSLF